MFFIFLLSLTLIVFYEKSHRHVARNFSGSNWCCCVGGFWGLIPLRLAFSESLLKNLKKCTFRINSHELNEHRRRSGRVVECTGLENRRTLTRTVGSNPTSSATTHSSFLLLVFLALFLRKIRGLKQSSATDTPHHLAYQR